MNLKRNKHSIFIDLLGCNIHFERHSLLGKTGRLLVENKYSFDHPCHPTWQQAFSCFKVSLKIESN